jgi:hypothetical protein
MARRKYLLDVEYASRASTTIEVELTKTATAVHSICQWIRKASGAQYTGSQTPATASWKRISPSCVAIVWFSLMAEREKWQLYSF